MFKRTNILITNVGINIEQPSFLLTFGHFKVLNLMSGIPDFKNLVFKDTSFANLMNKRIYNILLIATKYDAFMLEDDGRVDEQIFNEYTSLSLRYPPRFTQVTNEEEALTELKKKNYELIICMPNMDNRDIFAAAKEIKIHYPEIPIVVLTPFSKEVSKRV